MVFNGALTAQADKNLCFTLAGLKDPSELPANQCGNGVDTILAEVLGSDFGDGQKHTRYPLPYCLSMLLIDPLGEWNAGWASAFFDQGKLMSTLIHELGHTGWLVRTSEHCLVFDYQGSTNKGSPKLGALSPEVLTECGKPVLLFVSHAHGDHYNRNVLGLRQTVANLTVVMGWKEPNAGAGLVPPDGEWTDVSGAGVFALHHDFDGIPEGFFLVRSGGLTIYHSGDHGTWSDPPNETFRRNIDRLATAAERVDLAFISSFGSRTSPRVLNAGDVYTIKALTPRVTVPGHCRACEEQYAAFAREVGSLGLPTMVGVADAPGASFHYRGGRLR